MINVGNQNIDYDDLETLVQVNKLTPAQIKLLADEKYYAALYYKWIDELGNLTDKGRDDYAAATENGRIKPKVKRKQSEATLKRRREYQVLKYVNTHADLEKFDEASLSIAVTKGWIAKTEYGWVLTMQGEDDYREAKSKFTYEE